MSRVLGSGFPFPNRLKKCKMWPDQDKQPREAHFLSPVEFFHNACKTTGTRKAGKERAKASPGSLRIAWEGGERVTELGEGTQGIGCLKSHYVLLCKFSIIMILMALISLQFGAMMF